MASGVRESYLRIAEGWATLGGRFTTIRRIGPTGGDGAFSIICTAVDVATGQEVILKLFDPAQLGNTYRLDSFHREADLLQSLSGQPDIVVMVAPRTQHNEILTTTTGLTLQIEFNYYAVERAEGDVGQVVALNAWTPEEILIGYRSMCRAVQRVHRQRIVHRDLKPSNFLVFSDGSVKLSDFGAASSLTSSSRLLGSYAFHPGDTRYSAPEMVACLHDCDPSIATMADMYSLGAILFELFSGELLGGLLFDASFWSGLNQAMVAVPVHQRQAAYDQFVAQMEAARPLPSLATAASLPACIASRINSLYRSLAAIDYRKRVLSFSTIFNEINSALIILRKELAYRRWLSNRERRSLIKLGRLRV